MEQLSQSQARRRDGLRPLAKNGSKVGLASVRPLGKKLVNAKGLRKHAGLSLMEDSDSAGDDANREELVLESGPWKRLKRAEDSVLGTPKSPLGAHENASATLEDEEMLPQGSDADREEAAEGSDYEKRIADQLKALQTPVEEGRRSPLSPMRVNAPRPAPLGQHPVMGKGKGTFQSGK